METEGVDVSQNQMGYSDLPDKFPKKANYNGTLEVGIESLLSHHENYEDEIFYSDDDGDFDIDEEDEMFIADETDNLKETHRDEHKDTLLLSLTQRLLSRKIR